MHPRVILLSLLPVALAGSLAFGLSWLYWEAAVDGVRVALESFTLLAPVTGWLNDISGGAFSNFIGPAGWWWRCGRAGWCWCSRCCWCRCS